MTSNLKFGPNATDTLSDPEKAGPVWTSTLKLGTRDDTGNLRRVTIDSKSMQSFNLEELLSITRPDLDSKNMPLTGIKSGPFALIDKESKDFGEDKITSGKNERLYIANPILKGGATEIALNNFHVSQDEFGAFSPIFASCTAILSYYSTATATNEEYEIPCTLAFKLKISRIQ